MTLPLSGKYAVITASSEGLGFGCAQALHNAGAHVILCSRSEEKLEKAKSEIDKNGERLSSYTCDLSNQESLERFIQSVNKDTGVPDIVVVSTHHPPTRPFSKTTLEEWKLGHDLTIQPSILMGQAWLPEMKSKNHGRFIVIGSIFGKEFEESSVIQSTYRAGLHGMIKCVAREYAPFGISANIIQPGYFETPLVRNLAGQYAQEQGRSTEDVMDEWKASSPANRYGRLDEIGALACHLASDQGGFINGEVITIDGATTRCM